MAIAPTKNSTSPIILIAIVAIGLILGYFYYSFALKDQAQQITPFTISPEDNLSKFANLKLDFGPFDDIKFRSLRIFGESPVQSGITGKADLFAPF